MIRVIGASATSGQLSCLREWFVAEWGKEGSFNEGRATGPGPLLAIEDGEPLGGLAFTSFHRPGSDLLGLWINAVFVAPEHRRKGVASQLVRAAEAEADRLGEDELYALTDIPELYEKLSWRCIRSDGAGTVVGKKIAK